MAPDPYVGATDHYTSPSRRDWVKRAWEEPTFIRHLDAAIGRSLAHGLRADLDVLDIGCGTGVGLDLLLAVPLLAGTATLRRATGLDLDDDLLAVARGRFAQDPRITFERGDMTRIPDVGYRDVLLSSGVPYSHLTLAELEAALIRMFSVTVAPDRPTLAVIDVLGRWSIEWTQRWDVTRWDYRMSFFATDVEPVSTPMTTWSGTALTALIERAASAAGVQVVTLDLVDRSIAVGRHTSTGEYTPELPRLRDLVSALADPAVDQDAAALRLMLSLPAAPDAVLALHRDLAEAWNAALDAHLAGAAPSSAAAQLTLAHALREIERERETRGLGVGHSLTAFALLARA